MSSVSDILDLVRAAQERRRVAETRVNARSSRSHCIFTMKVRCCRRVRVGELENVGKLHLVDLAGSECAKKASPTPDDGKMCLAGALTEMDRERRNINQSLLTLGRVIGALREKSGRVPYRDSKLTRLLKDALGGSCKTVIIATISPALSAVEETISTLTYAEQASGIQNKPVASSLLKTSRMGSSGDLRIDGIGPAAACGASDWNELEMKVFYLTQEVEEAQAALARTHQESQELVERAEGAERELSSTKAELSNVRGELARSEAARTRLVNSAESVRADLTVSEQTLEITGDNIAREISNLRGHRASEERLVNILAQQRRQLQEDVAQTQLELQGTNAELAAARAGVEALAAEQEQSRRRVLEAIVSCATTELSALGEGLAASAGGVHDRLKGAETQSATAAEAAAAAGTRGESASTEASELAASWSRDVSAACDSAGQRCAEAVGAARRVQVSAAARLGALGEALEELPEGEAIGLVPQERAEEPAPTLRSAWGETSPRQRTENAEDASSARTPGKRGESPGKGSLRKPSPGRAGGQPRPILRELN